MKKIKSETIALIILLSVCVGVVILSRTYPEFMRQFDLFW